jgi:NTE family protein
LASSAIPLLFAPVKIGWSISATARCGNRRPSARRCTWAPAACWWWASAATRAATSRRATRYTGQQPTLAQIGGHMLNSTFIDSLESDIELLQRLNQFSHLQPADSAARGLAPVEVLVIAPSQPIDEIAARHRQELPAALRLFLRAGRDQDQWGGGVELSCCSRRGIAAS